MRSKFNYLVKYSLMKKINTKWFKVVNILLCLLIIFLVNMDYIINFFGGDFDKQETIYVVDNAGAYDSFNSYFNLLKEQLDVEDKNVVLDNSIINKTDDIDDEIIVVLNSSTSSYLTGEIISYDTVDTTTYEMIVSSLNAVKSEIVLATSGLTSEEISSLTSPVNVKETILNDDAQDTKTKETLSGVVTTVIIIPFFLLIVTMVQMLGAEINDEKSSRGMEIIISSVPVKMHFLSKVVASLTYVLMQGALLFLYSSLAIFLQKVLNANASDTLSMGSMFGELTTMLSDAGIFNLLAKGSLVLLVLFVVSFIAYAIVSATLASMTVNIEDFQQLQSPLMIIMLVGYYVALMATMFNGSIFIHILAYIPLLSVMIAPTLYLIGEMSLVSLIGTTLVTILCTYALYHYGLKIYKVGILNYSSTKLWHKMFKSLKEK